MRFPVKFQLGVLSPFAIYRFLFLFGLDKEKRASEACCLGLGPDSSRVDFPPPSGGTWMRPHWETKT